MALWGKADSIYSPGTISLVYGTKIITGSGTSFTSAYVGSVIYIGTGNTVGEAVIDSVTNATTVSIASTQFLSGVAVAGLRSSGKKGKVQTTAAPKAAAPAANRKVKGKYDNLAKAADNILKGLKDK